MKRKLVVSLVSIIFIGVFSIIPAVAQEKLASSITVYMGASPEANDKVSDFIKAHTGVEIKQTFMSYGEIGAKMKAEAPRFSADMCIFIGTPQAYEAKKQGWLIPYDSPTWRGASKIWKDPENYYFNLVLDAIAWVVNKNMLAEKGYSLPKSWDDLLDPKWKGEVVIPSAVTSGNGYKIVYGVMQLYGFNKGKGEKGGWEFLEALDKQVHHYTRSGAAPIEFACRGEFMMAIGDNVNVFERLKQGYPITLIGPKEGTSGDASYACILKGTKNLYTCQKIIDFLGTKEFGDFNSQLSSASTKGSTMPIPLYQGKPEYPEGKPIYIQNLDAALQWGALNRERIVEQWKAKFMIQGREAK